jgi:hypothetical protein
MSYGFDQAFIKLNDLRMYMATVADVEDRDQVISTLMDDPSLRVATAGNKHRVFRTVGEYLKRSQEFAVKCKETFSLTTDDAQVVPFGGRYANATCILIGCGEGFDEEVVRKAQDNGAVVIALGNAIHLYSKADIWVGYRKPPAYVNEGFVSPSVIGIYPEEFKDEKLWHSNNSSKTWSNIRVGECPNMLFYSRAAANKSDPGHGVEDMLDHARITCMGVQTCMTIGLSFTVLAGFRNIVLHGTSFTAKYAFEEEVYPRTATRKLHSYGVFQNIIHPSLWTALADRYISLWATKDVPLETLRFPKDSMLIDSIGYATTFSRAVNSISGISEPVDSKISSVERQRHLQQTTLTANTLGDRIDKLLENWPKRLKNKEVFEEAKRQMDEASKKKGGCTGCARGRIFVPALRKFAEMADKASGKARSPINQLWKKVFPEHLNVMHKDQRVLHPLKMQAEEKA